MKTLVIFLVLAMAAVMSNAQGLIELKEARVEFNPLDNQVSQVGNRFSYTVKEKYSGEFQKDPLAFVKQHFDVNQFIEEVSDKGYSSYEVSFKTNKGDLLAKYNSNGELLNTFQKFENVAMPNAVYHQIYRENLGWSMVKNQHIKKEKDGVINQNFYKVTMKKGNKKRNLKLEAASPERIALNQN